MDYKSTIRDWLDSNKPTIIDLTYDLHIHKLKCYQDEALEFHQDISEDYLKACRILLEIEICKQFAFPVDSVRIALEECKFEDYLL